MKNIFYLSFFIFIPFLLISCTKGTFVEKSFSDVKSDYIIKSSGKSNKDFIGALDIWGAQTFGDWQKVKQATNEERGIFVYRYRDTYNMAGNVCGVMISVQLKRIDKKTLSVTFSNIVLHNTHCGWINELGVAELSTKFTGTSKRLEKVIADF